MTYMRGLLVVLLTVLIGCTSLTGNVPLKPDAGLVTTAYGSEYEFNGLIYKFSDARFEQGYLAINILISNPRNVEGQAMKPTEFLLVDDIGHAYPAMNAQLAKNAGLSDTRLWYSRNLRVGAETSATLYFENNKNANQFQLEIVPEVGSRSINVPLNSPYVAEGMYKASECQNPNTNNFISFSETNQFQIGVKSLQAKKSANRGRITSAKVYVRKALNFNPWDNYFVLMTVGTADGTTQRSEIRIPMTHFNPDTACLEVELIAKEMPVVSFDKDQRISVTLQRTQSEMKKEFSKTLVGGTPVVTATETVQLNDYVFG